MSEMTLVIKDPKKPAGKGVVIFMIVVWKWSLIVWRSKNEL